MKCTTWQVTVSIALLAALSGCMDNRYYVSTAGSADLVAGVAELKGSPTTSTPLELGVTFRSSGKVSREASATLYDLVSTHLAAKGRWDVHQVGHPGDDFASIIAAVDSSAPNKAAADRKPGPAMTPRLLVLIDDVPDFSSPTTTDYFLSGMSYGAYGAHRATDRYNVTIAYRDASGFERIYHGHQELVFATGSKIFGRDETQVAGLKQYDSPLAAFDGIVNNSVNGSRHGTVTVGKVMPGPSAARVASVP